MSQNKWGGLRKGAGRLPIKEEERKKGVKIYIDDKLKDDIIKYGIGNSFSDKSVNLIKAEIQQRKDNFLNKEKGDRQ